MATNPLNLNIAWFNKPSDTDYTILNILATYLPTESSVPPQQAAEQLHALLPAYERDYRTPNGIKASFLSSLWDVVCYIACQLDYQDQPMQRLIDLIKAMENLPVVVLTERDCDRSLLGTRVWQDRPYLSWSLAEREHWFPDLEFNWPDEVRATRNFHGFVAHLINNDLGGVPDISISAITRALESDIGRSRDPQKQQLRRETLALEVPIAAIHLTLSASKLYRACRERRCADEPPGELWKGSPSNGYSVPRWRFWRARLKDISEYKTTPEETAVMCRKALRAMDCGAR